MSKLHVGLDVSQKTVATRFVLDDGGEPIKGFSFQDEGYLSRLSELYPLME